MRRSWSCFVVVVLVACTGSKAPAPATGSAPGSVVATPPADAPAETDAPAAQPTIDANTATAMDPDDTPGSRPAPILSDAVRAKICKAEPCGSEMSQIRVYRDSARTVKRLFRIYGGCSHSPGIYFDVDGKPTETIPEKPITPGSDEAKAIEAKHQAQVGGLQFTDVISCKTGARSAPN